MNQIANFVEELRWRGMIQDIMPGTEQALLNGKVAGYIGFDPTAPSLTVGNLVAIMLLAHFQRAGHKPVIVMGGATGMIGDPSFKSQERPQMSLETIAINLDRQKSQFLRFLDFDDPANAAEITNNYDWLGEFKLLDFLREAGTHLTINYMIAKDSVKNRMETGLSFTEFSYQLLQGYDFYHLFKHKNVILQMGGSDQWGNITAGTELIRRMAQGEAFALTSPLLLKADGTKFGKSTEGNVWLDASLTSPYQFYQFWLNSSDDEAARYIRYFTFLNRHDIESLETEHAGAPHARVLQRALAKDLTLRIHGEGELNKAISASELLFGEGSLDFLRDCSETDINQIFDSVPSFALTTSLLDDGVDVLTLLSTTTSIFSSKGETRKMIQGGGLSMNKEKLTSPDLIITRGHLLAGRFMVIQKGKKNYYLLSFQ